MSNWGHDDINDQANGNNENAGDGFRQYVKNLEQQNKDLNEKLTSFLEDQQKQKMSQVFESLGVPGAANVYQGEADPEKVKAWVESMRGVFGPSSAAPASEPVTQQPGMTPAEQHQYNMMSQAGVSETPLGNFEAAQTGLGAANSLDDILTAMKNLQGGGM